MLAKGHDAKSSVGTLGAKVLDKRNDNPFSGY